MAMAVAAASTMEVEQDLPGFRFHPTEEELLGFYLARVALGKKLHFDIIGTLNIYRHDPWDLPGMAKIGEREWYFFVPRDRKAGSGGRPNRTTERGFWKATGSDRAIRSTGDPSRVMGLKKTLVFYQGRAPRGTKTDWVMNEYRLPDPAAGAAPTREDTVLCKIYRKATPLRELEQRACKMEEMMMQRPDEYGGPAIVCPVPPAASTGDNYLSSSDDVQDNFLFHSFSTSSAAPSDTSKNDVTATEAKKEVAASSVLQAANPPYNFQLPAANPPCSLQLPAANPPRSLQLPANPPRSPQLLTANPPCSLTLPAANPPRNFQVPVAANPPNSFQLPPANPPRSFPLPLASPRCSLQLPTASHMASNLPSLQLPAAGHGVLEWLQDPFLTQLLSPWQDQHCLSPFAHLLY